MPDRGKRMGPFGALLLFPALALAAPPSVAVIATDRCDQPSTAAHARSYRQALSARLGGDLLTEAEAIAVLGGSPKQVLSLGEVERLLTGATADVFQDQSARALRTLTAVIDDVALLPPSPARFTALVDILSLVAHVHLKTAKSDPAAEARATAAYERILRVDPGWSPNIDLYPPATRNFVAALRNKEKKKSQRMALTVTTRPAGLPVFVNAKPLGPSPQTIMLLTGSYSVEADWGEGKRALAKKITIEQQAVAVELDKSLEGSIYPDTACVRTDGTRQGRLTIVARLAAILGVQTVHAIREEEPAQQERFVTAVTLNSLGEERVEGRIKLYAGNLSPAAWDSFVNFMLTGEKPLPPVEAVRGAKPDASVTQAPPEAVMAPVATKRSGPTGLRVGGAIAGGLGVGAGAAAIYFALQANQASQRLSELCTSGSCSSATFDELERSRNSSSTLAMGMGIGGGVALAAGIVMLVVSGQSSEPAAAGQLSVESTATGLLVRF